VVVLRLRLPPPLPLQQHARSHRVHGSGRERHRDLIAAAVIKQCM
jgi:hypothetical protein